MNPTRSTAISLLLLTACGSEPTTEIFATAGSRLRAQVIESIDGSARRFLQIFDTEVNQPCGLVKDGAGDRATCLPRAQGAIVFLDQLCTRPYVATAHGGESVVFAFGTDAPSTGPVRLGARAAEPGSARYLPSVPNGCLPSTVYSDLPAYEIEEHLPREAFAQGTFERVEVGGTLDAMLFNGDDGSIFLHELFDRTSGAVCAPAMTEAGARCRANIGEATYEGLLDTSCDRLVVADYSVDPVVLLDLHQRDGGQVYRFERTHDQEHVGRSLRDGCSVEPFNRGRMTLYAGVPYPAEEWPALRLESAGSDRLTTRLAYLPNGMIGDAASRMDLNAMFEDGGAPCAPMWSDGSLRCVPVAPREVHTWIQRFADPDCTEPALSMSGVTPPLVFALHDGIAGGAQGFLPTGRVRHVGHELRELDVYERQSSSGACVPQSAAPYSMRFFALGSEVPASSYPELRVE